MSENSKKNENLAENGTQKKRHYYKRKKSYQINKVNNNFIPNVMKEQHLVPPKSKSMYTAVEKEIMGKNNKPLIIEEAAAERPKSKAKYNQAKKKNTNRKRPSIKIISLGGLNEIGKNLTVYESGNDMFIIDCGLSFPDDDMLGIDLVLPDFTYLEKNADRIRGLVITHAHEDHIGAIPYLLKKMNIPIYGTTLTLGILEGKLKEHGLLNSAKLHVVSPGDTVKMGCMAVEFIRVNHSIPDACACAVFTPAGIIVHTGDFKIDYTPVAGGSIDLARFGELGRRGVLALLPDSTNADKSGSSGSEQEVSVSFDALFKKAGQKRILIATFASNVHRLQTIFDYAEAHGRKVAVSGRSMDNVVAKATELGYLSYKDGLLIDIDATRNYPDDKLVIITTGSQGEPMSALARMSTGDHKKITITPNDFIIISAHAIPGNEKLVNRLINDLMKLGADVIYDGKYKTHVSGHGSQEDLKLMMKLTNPKYVIPLHGEYKHLKNQKDIAISMGVPEKNVIISDIGKVIEVGYSSAQITGTVPAGRIMVDGLGVGDVGSIVLRDRKHLSEDGLIVVVATIDSVTGDVVAGPDVVSRGFVYVRESEDLMNEVKEICRRAIGNSAQCGHNDWNSMKQLVKDQVSQFLYVKTRRSPMILPIIQEI